MFFVLVFCFATAHGQVQKESVDDGIIHLRAGDAYFRVGHRPRFLLGRNPVAGTVNAMEPLIDGASEAGETLIRVHLTHGFGRYGVDPGSDTVWLEQWEAVFDYAQQRGVSIVPVFGNWADWNDGSNGESWHFWHLNPYNKVNGGTTSSPGELFEASRCQRDYLLWIQRLVGRWQVRPNIMAWEIFSELDLVTGSSQFRALQFIKSAAAAVREVDQRQRPITASLSSGKEWPALYNNVALDFIQVHPYANASGGHLDELILHLVPERLQRYGKPVFIGESGLDARGAQRDLNRAAQAPIALQNAIWAASVSGAMNGRMFWWEDGYDQFSRINLRGRANGISAPVAEFVKDVDYTGFEPINATIPESLLGAVLGNGEVRLGWFRDQRFRAPDWPVRKLSNLVVVLPDTDGSWEVQMIDTKSGKAFAKHLLRSRQGKLQFVLPEFEGSIAIKLKKSPS